MDPNYVPLWATDPRFVPLSVTLANLVPTLLLAALCVPILNLLARWGNEGTPPWDGLRRRACRGVSEAAVVPAEEFEDPFLEHA